MATKTESDTKKTTAKKTTGSGTKTTAAKSTAAKTTTAKTTAVKTTSTKSTGAKASETSTAKSTSKSTSSRSKKTKSVKLPKWLYILAFIVLAVYAGWFVYTNRAELWDIAKTEIQAATEEYFGPIVESELPEEQEEAKKQAAEKTTESTAKKPASTEASKTGKTKPAATKIVAGENGYSFEGDLGYAENDPLFFGNPSDAVADINANTNYLMIKDQYTVSYNDELLIPNWVAWHLSKENMGDSDRMDDFRPDPDLPKEWYAVKKADYQYNKYGYDRGHVCPSADRTATKNDNSMTFLMTNMMPQSPDNNRVIWMHFENFERELVAQGNEVYIIAGPYGKGGTGATGYFEEVEIKMKDGTIRNMRVPSHTWKVVIAIPAGKDDMSRVDEKAIVIAINVPNGMGIAKNGDWEQYLCSIDDIETMTGYDFFELLPDSVEDVLEAKVYERVK